MNSTEINTPEVAIEKTTANDILSIDVRNIIVPDSNSRTDYGNIEELADSLVKQGQKNPIRVKKVRGEDKYILIDGFRRMRAIETANKDGLVILKVKAIPVPVDYTEEQKVLDQVLCNDGKPLTNYEFGVVCVKLMKFGRNMAWIAKSVSRTKGHIENCVELTKVDPEIIEYIDNNEISSHAVTRIIQATTDPEERMRIVRQTVAVARRTNKKATTKNIGLTTPFVPTLKQLERVLTILDEKEVSNDKKELLEKLIISLKEKESYEIISELFV